MAFDYFESGIAGAQAQMDAHAADISEVLRPKRRYLITWLRWRFRCQPEQVADALEKSLKGDPAPLARLGLKVTISDG